MVTELYPKAEQIKEINHVAALTGRVKKRKAEYLASVPHICAERSRLVTQSWKETEGEPIDIRGARRLQKVLEGISVSIKDDELIVGSQTRYVRGASPPVEYNPYITLDIFGNEKVVARSEVEGAEATPQEQDSLLEDARYWKGRSAVDAIHRAWQSCLGNQSEDLNSSRIVSGLVDNVPTSSRRIDYPRVVREGLDSVIAQAKEERQKLTFSTDTRGDYEKACFLDAVVVACEAVITFARRYASLARKMAAEEKDPARKGELEMIAANCEWVPANPARSFYEGLQSMWLTHIAWNLEAAGHGETPGRLDQYLYPLYERDLKKGSLTRQQAAELLGCLWVKLNEMEVVREASTRQFWQGSHFQDVTICGLTPGGKDGTNELSFLILEVTRQMKMPQPAVYVRYNSRLSEEFLMKAVETARDHGAGSPAFLNDQMVITSMLRRGVSLDDAINWVASACAGNHPTSGSALERSAGHINLAKCLELALHNGVDPRTGKQLGPATGDARKFTSIEELYEAFKKHFDRVLEVNLKHAAISFHAKSQVIRYPFTSALIDDSIKRGKDTTQGGVRYPYYTLTMLDKGHVDVADSLAAIKKLVFEEKRVSMERLLQALKADFEGEGDKEIRHLLLAAPKYGNDDDYVDEIFNDLSLWAARRITQKTNPLGTTLRCNRSGASVHYFLGKATGALPSGRKAGEPLADGSLSPFRGADRKGPTAVIMSATKVNHQEEADVSLFNMKLNPMILNSREGMRKFIALTKTFFERGGYHIQFNLMGQGVLREAKEHPETHGDLVVRVAGYSAYFVDLSPAMQDEIIARMEHVL